MSAPSRAMALVGLVAAAWAGAEPAPAQAPPNQLPGPCSAAEVQEPSIVGVVREARTGRPLPGAVVSAARPSGDDTTEVRVAADTAGGYRMCGGSAGIVVSVRPDFPPRRGSPETLTLPPPVDRPVERELSVSTGRPGELLGRVRDAGDGSPVAAATVRLPALGVDVVTGDDGRFALTRLPPGRHEVRVEHVGHGVHADSIRVRPGQSARLTMRLTRDPVRVAPLQVEVDGVRSLRLERVGFYDRRKRGHGTYITRQQLEEWDPSQLSEAFRRVQGFRLGGPPVRRQVRSNRDFRAASPSGPCRTQFFVEGEAQPLPNGIDTFLPADVAALELYEGGSQLPARFNARSASCGAVVIWLRTEPDDSGGGA